VSAAVVSLAFAVDTQAQSLAFWDFENTTSIGPASTSNALSTAPFISAFVSQDSGGPAENFGPGFGIVFLTRYLGSYHPFIQFTTTERVALSGLTFVHFHNHNPGFPTNPSYSVQLQIDQGSGFVDIGAPLLLTPAGYGTVATMSLGNIILEPGTYTIRWDPRGLAYGPDTNTEFFAIDNLSLEGIAVPPIPTLSTWGLALLAVLVLLAGITAFWR
jgi:hypothetical protein